MGATTFLARSRRTSEGTDLEATTDPTADFAAAAPARTTGVRAPVVRRGGAQQWTLAPDAAVPMPSPEVQALWLTLRRTPWRSVAVVPTGHGASELVLAEQLVVVGVADTRRPVTLVSARGIGVAGVEDAMAMVRVAMLRAELVVVVVDPVVDNPATAAVLRSLDASVLTVCMGETRLDDVDRTIAAAAPSRVLGVVTRA